MNRPLKTAFLIAALAIAAMAVSVSPAVAKSKTACWKLVINDWYDGTISGKYKLHCYRDALGHLNPDLEGYSSARDDIRRALNQRIAEIAAAKKKKEQQQAAPPKSNSVPPSGPTNGSSGPTKPQPPAVVGSSNNKGHSNANKHSTSSNSTGNTTKPKTPKQVGVVPGGSSKSQTSSPTTTPGRNTGEGPATRLINKLGPKDATALPIPLLVLAGLATLLMFGGAITLVAKRAQARRLATVPVRSAESR